MEHPEDDPTAIEPGELDEPTSDDPPPGYEPQRSLRPDQQGGIIERELDLIDEAEAEPADAENGDADDNDDEADEEDE